jgi:hypothetical protein
MRMFRVSKGISMKSMSLSDVGHVLVCGGKCCKKESKVLRKALSKAAVATNGKVVVLKASGFECGDKGPSVVVWPNGILFQGASDSDVATILAAAGWEAPAEKPEKDGKPAKKKAGKVKGIERAKKPEVSAKTAKAERKPAKA